MGSPRIYLVRLSDNCPPLAGLPHPNLRSVRRFAGEAGGVTLLCYTSHPYTPGNAPLDKRITMTFKAPDSLAEQIAHHLAERIIRGELKERERIQGRRSPRPSTSVAARSARRC